MEIEEGQEVKELQEVDDFFLYFLHLLHFLYNHSPEWRLPQVSQRRWNLSILQPAR